MTARKAGVRVFVVAVLATLAVAWVKSAREAELPIGCDSFGYLEARQEIRQAIDDAWKESRLPGFSIPLSEAPQVSQLAELLKNSPADSWKLAIAPLAYHYKDADHGLINQYPPGTGAILALFPEGRSVSGWTSLSLIAIGFLFFSLFARRLRAGDTRANLGLLALGAIFFGHELGTIESRSYSINALLLPLVLGLSVWILWKKSRLLAPALSGALLAVCLLARIPSILCAPAALAAKRSRKEWLIFIASFFIVGILPLGIYQHALTGSWFETTYGPADNTRPTLAHLGEHLAYYLIGDGAPPSWMFLTALVGASLLRFQHRGRAIIAALLTWAGSIAFFATHSILLHYYMIPSAIAAMWCLVATACVQEGPVERPHGKSPLQLAMIALAFLPTAVGIEQSFNFLFRNLQTFEGEIRPALIDPSRTPEELVAPNAWIWADVTTGTFWYYYRKSAFKFQYTDAETRKKMFDYARSRGEPQYLIDDQPDMPKFMDEIRGLGGKFEPIASAFGYPAYKIVW